MNPTGSARVFPKQNGNIKHEGIKLFVDGLEERICHKQLRKIFEKYGRIISTFVPRKMKRKRRAKFGFVLFEQRKDGLEAMKNLHGKQIYNFFLSVNPARFIDNKLKWTPQINHKAKTSECPVKKEWRIKKNHGEGRPQEDKAKKVIRQVWRVKQKVEESPMKQSGMKQERVQKNDKLSRLAIVETREVLSCNDLKLLLAEKGFPHIQVLAFGAREKVLVCASVEERQKLLDNLDINRDSCFVSLSPAISNQRPKEYLIWLKLWKIPIGLWSLDFMKKVVASLGSVVCFDEYTLQGLRYDVARVLIAAPDPILENQIIPITYESMDCNVLVEIDCIYDESREQSMDEEGWISEEEEYSTGVGFNSPKFMAWKGGVSSSPANIHGEPDDIGNVSANDDASHSFFANDEECSDRDSTTDNRFQLEKSDWSRKQIWTMESVTVCPLMSIINGRSEYPYQKQFKITIPNELFNIFFFGCSYPIFPSHVVGLPLTNPTQVFISSPLLRQSTVVSLQEINENSGDKIVADNKRIEENLGDVASCSLGYTSDSLELEEEEILKRAKQGVSRVTKLKTLECLENDCAKPGKEKKKRGRKPRSEAGPSMLREISEGGGGVDPSFSELHAAAANSGVGVYFTRATKVWFLGKSLGLSYPGSDEDAIKGLAQELEEDMPHIRNN